MNHVFKGLLVLVCLLISSVNLFSQDKNNSLDSISIYTSRYNDALAQQVQNSDMSFKKLGECALFFKQKSDTLMYVNCLLFRSDIIRNKGEYALAFDYLWEALYLSSENRNIERVITIHRKLSLLYDYYGMFDQSMQHLESALGLSKNLKVGGDGQLIQLNSNYLNLAIKKRNLGYLEEALLFLDSCKVTSLVETNVPWFKPSMELERAKVLMDLGRYAKARESILIASKCPLEKGSFLQLLLYKRFGELDQKEGNVERALVHYQTVVDFPNYSDDALYNKAEVLSFMAALYSAKQQFKKAYDALTSAKQITDSLSVVRDKANGKIFAITNSYQQAIQNKNALIKEQDLLIQRKSAIQLRLFVIIGLLVLLIITFTIVWKLKYKLQKTVQAKRESELAAQAEIETSKIQVELKTRELTSYALQLVDKENSFKELLGIIKELSPKVYKSTALKFNSGEAALWQTFNKRFTEVNGRFYEELTLKYPDLSPTELKHCALIKLNLSTKDMAQILNVEGHTINMSRSRIRKKMGLNREDSLSKEISRFS